MERFLIKFLVITGLLLPCTTYAQDGWFEFKTHEQIGPSVIGMEDYLDKPAGKHGFLKSKGDKYVFEDGTEIKFWGVNLADSRIWVEQDVAKKWSSYLAKYGVNAVRFHKFSRSGYRTTGTSTVIDPEKFDKLDYFCKELKEKGIYYGWSHIYGHAPQKGDSASILAYSEVMKAGSDHLRGTTIGLVHFSEDLQDLSINLTVNMLNHKNPYTGVRYADDPALNFIELQNEDNAYFATAEKFLMDCPTYKAIACRKFSEWLRKKYGSHEGLVKAWGAEAIDAFPKNQTGEHLDKNNIFPMANHSVLSTWSITKESTRRRLLDTSKFLFDMQNAFYQRYAAAIRATGYKGELVGSCWMAGDNVSHFYNLYSDYLIGAIDRHNYWGGGDGGHRMGVGKVKPESMLKAPGTGLMNVGWQAVTDRPFAYSEWFAMSPNEWQAEAAPLIAAYGMGLQGWDASYVYAQNHPNLVNSLESPSHGVYNADAPNHIGLYPALARMIYSNEVEEGKPVGIHKVNFESLEEGKLDWDMKIEQNWDEKKIEGAVSPMAMAVGKVGVEFTPKYEKTVFPDINQYIDQTNKVIHSTTKQFDWYFGDNKGFTVNTPSTKMWVGFIENKKISAGDISLECKNPFAIVTLSSLERGTDINKSNSLLITTIGKTRNTGMKYSEDGKTLIEKGESPLLMEGIEATLTFPYAIKGKLYILNHDGERTDKYIEISGNKIDLSGSLHNTFYYEFKRSR
jgi:hypothetical protein